MDYGKYFPIVDYYSRVVMPLNSKFKINGTGSKSHMICPLHNDTDPSLGIVSSSKGELFHCFGCNSWGNVIDLHRKISKKYLNKYLTEIEATRDLCRLFDVDYKSLPKETESTSVQELSDDDAISKSLYEFSYSDFSDGILVGKGAGKGIGYFNTLLARMLHEIYLKKE